MAGPPVPAAVPATVISPMRISTPARGRKRKRGSDDVLLGAAPPPFAPARAALARGYTGPAPRVLASGPSQPAVNLTVVAASRLVARDFVGAAALLPVLLRRFRRANRSSWFFTREVTATGAEVLRRAGKTTDLETFLELIVRDPASSTCDTMGREGYAGRTRESALLELAVERISTGRMRDALDALRAEASIQPFASSALVHAYIGMLCVALAAGDNGGNATNHSGACERFADDSAIAMLSTAASALDTAARLDPAAHCFVHYAAAAAIAAGDTSRAVSLQRQFAHTNSTDPIALSALLSTLNLFRQTEDSRTERVATARLLLRTDPMSSVASQTLSEALSWSWKVSPPVDLVEVSDALACKIECGGGDETVWTSLLDLLRTASDAELALFIHDSGRSSWWATHFFRPTRAASDAATSTAFAIAKMSIAELLFGEKNSYVRAVSSLTKSLPDSNMPGSAAAECHTDM
jgi:TAF RNA Polymerase I subunit A